MRRARPDVASWTTGCPGSTAPRRRARSCGLARHARDLPDGVGLGGERGLVLAAGAVACVTKDEGLDRIVEAILAVGNGRGA